jgi:hypothetical protein
MRVMLTHAQNATTENLDNHPSIAAQLRQSTGYVDGELQPDAPGNTQSGNFEQIVAGEIHIDTHHHICIDGLSETRSGHPDSCSLGSILHMPKIFLALIATVFLTGEDPAVAGGPATPSAAAPFSAGVVGSQMPPGWQPVKLSDKKKTTAYDLVEDDGVVVLRARAHASASALGHLAGFALQDRPVISWRWKVAQLIEGADNSVAAKEDSPVRLLFVFDGDKSKLPPRDQAVFRLSKRLSERELPYATLMYVWSNTAAVGSVIENPHTRRVKMIVASSGDAGVGQWQTLSRNLAEDYKTAFGEAPGKLIAYGVMSDTDNTGASIEAWYGDIVFSSAKQ